MAPASGVRWGQRKCRPGRHLGGEVVHLANPTSVTCSAYRDNDDCALCNRLWYGVDGFAVVASGKPPLWNLPRSGGAFCVSVSPLRCVQPTVGWALGWWACVLESGRPVMATNMTHLAPLTWRGFCLATPALLCKDACRPTSSE